MKDYYKIGEISKIYSIGKDSLMYYEKLGILNPIRDKNGYRLYSINDIWRLNLIKELRALNFPMNKIKDYLDCRTIESTKHLLEEELKLLDEKIREFLNQKENIENRLLNIEKELNFKNFDKIELKYFEDRKAIILNGDIERDSEADFLIKKLHKKFEEKFNILGNNNIGAVFSLEEINKDNFNYYKSVFCFLEENEELSNVIIKEGNYVTCTYKGDYSNKKSCLKKIMKYIEKNNFKIKSDPLEIYKIDIHETGNYEEFITEIQVPIESQ